jgi:hypothetical protein
MVHQVVNVTPWPNVEVLLVQRAQRDIPLGGEHAFATEVLQRDMETPQPSEQVDEAKCFVAPRHRKSSLTGSDPR